MRYKTRTYDTYQRATELGAYIVEHGATVRSAAAKFGISKSTVHKDITMKLRALDPRLFEQVARILEHNKNERHIRGGNATKLKYKNREP